MSSRRHVSVFALVLCTVLGSSIQSLGQTEYRGRKYKAPPPNSHIVVQVFKKENGKPVVNAAVVFNPSMNGKDLGNLEVKTDPEGKATIDVIPVGSAIEVQIIANGFATFAQDYNIDGPSKEISVSLLRPRAQLSAYENNEGKASSRKAGEQDPVRPKLATPPASSATPPASSSTPNSTPKQ
jgi:hypothetical protein